MAKRKATDGGIGPEKQQAMSTNDSRPSLEITRPVTRSMTAAQRAAEKGSKLPHTTKAVVPRADASSSRAPSKSAGGVKKHCSPRPVSSDTATRGCVSPSKASAPIIEQPGEDSQPGRPGRVRKANTQSVPKGEKAKESIPNPETEKEEVGKLDDGSGFQPVSEQERDPARGRKRGKATETDSEPCPKRRKTGTAVPGPRAEQSKAREEEAQLGPESVEPTSQPPPKQDEAKEPDSQTDSMRRRADAPHAQSDPNQRKSKDAASPPNSAAPASTRTCGETERSSTLLSTSIFSTSPAKSARSRLAIYGGDLLPEGPPSLMGCYSGVLVGGPKYRDQQSRNYVVQPATNSDPGDQISRAQLTDHQGQGKATAAAASNGLTALNSDGDPSHRSQRYQPSPIDENRLPDYQFHVEQDRQKQQRKRQELERDAVVEEFEKGLDRLYKATSS